MKPSRRYLSSAPETAAEAAENERLLEQYYHSGAWKDYTILAHSIKSVSATIGASRLSEAAAKQEAAGRKEDIAELTQGHQNLLSLYLRTADAVRPFGAGPDSALPESSAVMEFMPE